MTSTTAATDVKTINITTSDGVNMKVERPVAERSILIKNLLEDLGGESEEHIPIPNVRTLYPAPPANSH
jgi:S-phase kinase-associated protein 1